MNSEILLSSDIPRIFTGIAEWLACVLLIVFWKKRFKIGPTIAIMAGFLLLQVGFQIWAGYWPLEIWLLGMLVAVVIMFAFLFCTLKLALSTAVTLTFEAFIIAEFSAAFEWQIYWMLCNNLGLTNNLYGQWGFFILICGVFFTLLFFLDSRMVKQRKVTTITKRDMISVICIALSVFVISNLNFLIDRNHLSQPDILLWIFYIRTLVNLSGVILLIMHRIMRYALQTEKETMAVNTILETQYRQYIQHKENVSAINQKYHDLRHQLLVIRGETNATKRESHILEMENDLKHITGVADTGNSVLNVILTTKNFDCIENNINFTSVVNGEILGFIKTIDLCSIFGNILDNAIEGAKKVKTLERRIIKLSVFTQGDFLSINCENYFETDLVFDSDNLVSTKKNRNLHGFGLKSIRYAVARYDGSVLINTSDNWFKISILVPVPPSLSKPNLE